ncbi:hypothetical protein [Desulfofarcimen acetoxidans]|uniref:hypothetical protein n=1 Tax=Desulfofarcimen acetoxidans TaxID=58138 RepID=UPI0012FF12E5|nr:hypothetical protein [Desulfofarcimen acetoxidans]
MCKQMAREKTFIYQIRRTDNRQKKQTRTSAASGTGLLYNALLRKVVQAVLILQLKPAVSGKT